MLSRPNTALILTDAGHTADVQYMKDRRTKVSPSQDNTAGWIFGLRATAGF
jgi:hypothetical protein